MNLYRHQGNIVFRELVKLNKEIYSACKKTDKINVSKRVVNLIMSQNPPGRFLEFDSCSSNWKIISYKRALEKASQALREGNNNSRRRSSSIRYEEHKGLKHKNYACSMSAKLDPNHDTIAKPNFQSDSSQIESAFCHRENQEGYSQYAVNAFNADNDSFMSSNLKSCNPTMWASLNQEHCNKVTQCPINTFKAESYSPTQDAHVQHITSFDDNRMSDCKGHVVEAETVEANEELDDCILMAFNNDSNQTHDFEESKIKLVTQKSIDPANPILNFNEQTSESLSQSQNKIVARAA